MDPSAHGDLETLWDKAVTPVAIEEEIVPRDWVKERVNKTDYSDQITFTLDDCLEGGAIEVQVIPRGGLMDFMIAVCLTSKKRGQQLFPIENPQQRNDDELPAVTREIFADSIGDLMALWQYMWSLGED